MRRRRKLLILRHIRHFAAKCSQEAIRSMKSNCMKAITLLIFALCGNPTRSDSLIPANNSSPSPTGPRVKTTTPDRVIEILTLDVKPGRRGEFHNVYEAQSLPLLKKWGFQVLAHGPSLHDANSYSVPSPEGHRAIACSIAREGTPTFKTWRKLIIL